MEARQTLQGDSDWIDCLDSYNSPIKDELAEVIEKNYSPYPTVIQLEAIDRYAMNMAKKEKKAYFIQAPGGSGKTLTFTIPIVMEACRVYKEGEQFATYETKKVKGKDAEVFRYHPQIVVLCDTKTLSEQLASEISKCIPKQFEDKIKVTQLSSGQTKKDQFGDFHQILVITPQLLVTLMESKQDNIFLDKCVLMAIDEAEHCYSNAEGVFSTFVEELKRQGIANLMSVSATLTEDYMSKIRQMFYGDQKVSGEKITQELNLQGVTQYSVECPKGGKDENLNWIYKEIIKTLKLLYKPGKSQDAQVIIFFNEVKQLDNFNNYFQKSEIGQGEDKVSFDVIHSKMRGEDRFENNKALRNNFKKFRDAEFKVLLTTNIMARGIDIKQVGLVINVFCPRNQKERLDSNQNLSAATFIHRVARTGRHKQIGVCLSYYRNDGFFSIPDNKIQEELAKTISVTHNNVRNFNSSDSSYLETIVKSTEDAVEYNLNNA